MDGGELGREKEKRYGWVLSWIFCFLLIQTITNSQTKPVIWNILPRCAAVIFFSLLACLRCWIQSGRKHSMSIFRELFDYYFQPFGPYHSRNSWLSYFCSKGHFFTLLVIHFISFRVFWFFWFFFKNFSSFFFPRNKMNYLIRQSSILARQTFRLISKRNFADASSTGMPLTFSSPYEVCLNWKKMVFILNQWTKLFFLGILWWCRCTTSWCSII